MALCKIVQAAIIALCATQATAQDWATPEVCTVPADAKVQIYQDDLPYAPLPKLEALASDIPNGIGKYWRITAPNGAVSHLWGTFHSSDPLVLDLPATVKADIAKARVVALEIDPVIKSREAYKTTVLQEDRFRPLDSGFAFAHLMIDPKVERWILDRLDGLGWGADAADYLTLGALSELLLWAPCADFSAGVIPDQDSYIQTLGMIAGADILGLEPVDRLRNMLDRPENLGLARAMIESYGTYLAPRDTWHGQATDMAIYLQGRLSLGMALDQDYVTGLLGDDGLDTYRRMDSYLLDQRNLDFLTAGLDDLTNGGVFMAVGYFHLPGERGMVALLRDAGFDVVRVPLPGEVSQ